jgi:hypothetical protein
MQNIMGPFVTFSFEFCGLSCDFIYAVQNLNFFLSFTAQVS